MKQCTYTATHQRWRGIQNRKPQSIQNTTIKPHTIPGFLKHIYQTNGMLKSIYKFRSHSKKRSGIHTNQVIENKYKYKAAPNQIEHIDPKQKWKNDNPWKHTKFHTDAEIIGDLVACKEIQKRWNTPLNTTHRVLLELAYQHSNGHI